MPLLASASVDEAGAEKDVSPDRAYELLRAAGAGAPVGSETVTVAQASGRVLGEDLASLVDRPPADDSALDGYACLVSDTASASVDRPVRLRLVGRSHAGAPFTGRVGSGEAAYVATGGFVPASESGEVGVVGVENAAEEGGSVSLTRAASSAAVRARARDLRAGVVYLRAGDDLGPVQVGLIAGMGHAQAVVARRPRVAIVSTGDELVSPGSSPEPGQLFESNLPTLVAAATQSGYEVARSGRVADEPAALARLLDDLASDGIDLALTIGGISKGEREPVREVLEASGELVFQRVTARPGGPLTFFRHGSLPVLALPGNPVSSLVCFSLFARAFLDAALGRTAPPPYRARLRARAAQDLASDAKTVFHRVSLSVSEDGAVAMPFEDQSSAVSRSLAFSSALAVAPPGGVRAGEVLDVIPLRWP